MAERQVSKKGKDNAPTEPAQGVNDAPTGTEPAHAPGAIAQRQVQERVAKEAAINSTTQATQGGKKAFLQSPQPFGIYVDGLLVRFKKGMTPLNVRLLKACQEDGYVADNRAEIIWR